MGRDMRRMSPLTGSAELLDGTIGLTCHQQKGMSNAAVLNFSGRVGMVVATGQGSYFDSRLCAAIPNASIRCAEWGSPRIGES